MPVLPPTRDSAAQETRSDREHGRSEILELVRQAVQHGGMAETIAIHLRDALVTVLTFDRRNDDVALLVPSRCAFGNSLQACRSR